MEYLCTVNITTEDKLSNLNFITSKDELNKIVFLSRQHNTVTVRKDFVDMYFPYNTFSEYLDTVTKVNFNLTVKTDGFDIIDGRVNSNVLELLKKSKDKDDISMLLHFRPHDFTKLLFNLIDNYEKGKEYELSGASTISNLIEQIDNLRLELEESNKQLEQEIVNKVDVQNKLSVLVNRINYTHNVGVDENMMFNSLSNNYDKILYIKELTRVQYTDTLIYMLQDIFKLLYNMPTRIIVIEGYYANGKIEQYPTLIPHYKLTENDVLSGDILMLGYQPKLFRDIMRNPSNISITIILDRGGYKSHHLFSSNVEYLFTASDLKDVPSDVPMDRVISYSKGTLNIPYVKEFGSMTRQEKVQRYSSMNIVKNIVKLIE